MKTYPIHSYYQSPTHQHRGKVRIEESLEYDYGYVYSYRYEIDGLRQFLIYIKHPH